ncbi:hypothetical protein [Janibacter sp. G1551]|uniref:hypothetical protein n=1 Tax=Janibacter sp. G1551 TaxID=3420440 RepID=UPI003D069315
MSMLPLALLVAALLLLLGLITAVVLLAGGRTSRPDPTPVATFEAARRHASRATLAAWVLGGTTGVVLFAATPRLTDLTERVPGLLPALAPTAAGLVFAAVHAVGEVTWPRPTGSVRTAILERRTVADVAPRPLRRALWCLVLLGALAVVVLGLVAAPDGRSIERDFTSPEGWAASSSAGPFPGWPYGLPMLAGWILLLGASEWMLRRIANRPAVVGTTAPSDLSLRRLSAHRVLRGIVLAVAIHLGVILLVAAMAARSVGSTAPALALLALGLVTALAGLVLAALPAAAPTDATA